MLAKRAARSSARRLVSPPSNATAQECIGEGEPPHTMTHRSAMVISELTVGPSASAAVTLPRRPTRTASTVFASSASTRSGLPSRSTSSTASPVSATRSLARASRAAPFLPAPSRTVAVTSVAPKRWPSWIACSRAASALGLPSRPISRRVNMDPSWKNGEPLDFLQPKRQHFTRHRQSSFQELVSIRRFEPLGDHHIFGAPARQRHPAVLTHRALKRIERLRGEGKVLGDAGHEVLGRWEGGGVTSPSSCPGDRGRLVRSPPPPAPLPSLGRPPGRGHPAAAGR